MVQVFEIESEDHVPYRFGSYSQAHILQCRQHRDVITLSWD